MINKPISDILPQIIPNSYTAALAEVEEKCKTPRCDDGRCAFVCVCVIASAMQLPEVLRNAGRVHDRRLFTDTGRLCAANPSPRQIIACCLRSVPSRRCTGTEYDFLAVDNAQDLRQT